MSAVVAMTLQAKPRRRHAQAALNARGTVLRVGLGRRRAPREVPPHGVLLEQELLGSTCQPRGDDIGAYRGTCHWHRRQEGRGNRVVVRLASRQASAVARHSTVDVIGDGLEAHRWRHERRARAPCRLHLRQLSLRPLAHSRRCYSQRQGCRGRWTRGCARALAPRGPRPRPPDQRRAAEPPQVLSSLTQRQGRQGPHSSRRCHPSRQ